MKQRSAAVAVLAALGGCAIAAAYGLVSTSSGLDAYWPGGTLWHLVAIVSAVLAGVVPALHRSGRAARRLWLGGLAGILCLFVGLGPVAAIMLLFAAAFAIGDLVCRPMLGERFDASTRAALSAVMGLGLLSWGVGLLAHFPVNYGWVYLSALGAVVLVRRARLGQVLREVRDWAAHETPSRLEVLAGAGVAAVLALHAAVASWPEHGWDALAFHLHVATDFFYTARWDFDVRQFVGAVQPMGGDWLFAAAYLVGREQAARLVNLTLLVVAMALVYGEVRRRSNAPGALLAAALFASVPMAFAETASMFVEDALLVFALGAFVVLSRAWDGMRARELVLIAILLGLALHTKLHAAFFAAVIVPLALWRAVVTMGWRSMPRAAGIAALAGAAMAAPPYLYAYVATGNPLFPYFNALFESPLFPIVNFTDPRWTGHATWDLLYRMTVDSSRFIEERDGALGVSFLVLLGPALVLASWRRDRVFWLPALVGLGYCAGVLWQIQYIRYLYPAFPLLSIAIAHLWTARGAASPRPIALTAAAAAVIALGVNLYLIPSLLSIDERFGLNPLAEPLRRRALLDARVPERHLIDTVNALAGRQAHVLVLGWPVAAGLEGEPLLVCWYNGALERDFAKAKDVDAMQALLSARAVTHVILADDSRAPNVDVLRRLLFERGRGQTLERVGAVQLVGVLKP